MRHTPYAIEYASAPTLSDGERLDYFLTRAFETEEVWILRDTGGQLLLDRGGDGHLPVWPYQVFARDAAILWPGYEPCAQALEDFAFTTLIALIDADIGVDVMPRATAAGCLITPHRLLDIFEGMFDSGEYRLDG